MRTSPALTRAWFWVASMTFWLAAGCASSETLPQDAPVTEPGYPAQAASPEAEPSAGVSSGEPTPFPAPSAGVATPAPQPSPSSAPPGTTATPPDPPPAADPGADAIVLATAAWLPVCDGQAAPPDPNPRLELTIPEIGEVAAGGELAVTVTLTNTYARPIQQEDYYAVLTLTREGKVITTATGGISSASQAALGVGESLPLAVGHPLHEGCDDGSGMVGAAAAAGAILAQPTTGPSASAPVQPTPAATPSATPPALAPGSYQVEITIHVVRDNGVVAMASSPLTITAAGGSTPGEANPQ